MEIKPICKCLAPKRVINPYTNKVMIVPCGHCVACSLNKSQHYVQLLQMEASYTKYCVFVTLTYAPAYLPKAYLVDSDRKPFANDLVDEHTGEIICSPDLSLSDASALLKKFNLNGFIPYLRVIDLQKFLKRLRYYVSKRTNEKVRYFACCEYGPVHFRPHYHLLFFFDSEETLSLLEQSVYQSWPFGRCDIQLSKGAAAQYVAGYVNSVVSIPKIFKMRPICPFTCHSQRLGVRFLESEREKVYSSPVRDVIKRCVVVDGKSREFTLPVSYTSYFFPKCKGFSELSARECVTAYRIYSIARKCFPDAGSTLALAKEIAAASCIFAKGVPVDHEDAGLLQLLQYFHEYDMVIGTDDIYTRYVNRIYHELLVSKHFLSFVCDKFDCSYDHMYKKVMMIKEFYSQLDYLNLTAFFENQQAFFVSDLIGADDLQTADFDNDFYPYMYDNVRFSFDDYFTTPLFKYNASKWLKLADDRIKHKRLNDANRIFCD